MGWCWLDLQQAAGHRIQSLEWIPLSFFTDNAGKAFVRENHPLIKGIPPYNGQWQPDYNFLGDQFGKHCGSNRCYSLSKTHFICHQCSWYISLPNPSPHDEPDGPHLVPQKLSSGQIWNWIPAAWNTVIWWLVNRTRIQQPDCFINTVVFKFVVSVLRTVFSTELVLPGSRTSSPSSTCSWTSRALLSVFFLSSMISFSCSDVSRVDMFIFRRSGCWSQW